MVRTERAVEVVVGQRLKRVPRIIRKLQRTVGSGSGRTALARLEDIGGVRAILLNGEELDRVRLRLERNWGSSFRRQRDYIKNPKDIRYRAVHLVVVRDDSNGRMPLRRPTPTTACEVSISRTARLRRKCLSTSAQPVRSFTAASTASLCPAN